MHRLPTNQQSPHRSRPVPRLLALVSISVVLFAGLLTGCSSGGSTSSNNAASNNAASKTEGKVNGGAPAQDSSTRELSPRAGTESAQGTTSVPGAAARPSEVSKSGTPQTPAVGVGPKLTRSASLDIRVKDVQAAAARVRSIAAGLQAQLLSEQIGGGGVGDPIPLQNHKELSPANGDKSGGSEGSNGDGSNSDGSNGDGSNGRSSDGSVAGGANDFGTVTLSVPADKLDTALDQLARIGTVQRRSSSSQDVTGQYVDTQSRLKTMRASVERVRALMAQAKNLGQVVALESEMSRRQADLESLESQLASLKSSVERSTLAVSLSTATHETVTDSGFLAGLGSSWDAFVDSASGLLTAIGAVLPFALFFALVGVPLVRWLRHRRKVSTTGTTRA
jgi:hypothetical protein